MESRLREQGLRRTPRLRSAWNSDGHVGAVLRTAQPTACKTKQKLVFVSEIRLRIRLTWCLTLCLVADLSEDRGACIFKDQVDLMIKAVQFSICQKQFTQRSRVIYTENKFLRKGVVGPSKVAEI